MKILIIADEEWNDYVYGNNVLTNWFTGFDAKFAEIYCSPGLPNNTVCKNYFQITDAQMFKSLFTKHMAGGRVFLPESDEQKESSKENVQRKGAYGFMKKVSTVLHTPVMMMRDFIWCNGRYDIEAMKEFVNEFAPDVVFCPRLITPKLMRLEKLVSTMTTAPFVAFTADDEASLLQVNYSPLYWIRRLWIRGKFKKHVGLYKYYFTFSREQAEDYHKEYGLPTSALYKCGDFLPEYIPKTVNEPIQMVYAGGLYCNRWKTLGKIGEALREINKDSVKMVLNVYSQDELTTAQKKVLCKENYVYFKGSVTPTELVEIYQKADIALHVESFDKKYRYATRVSFSTKIIDLMASSCAILAICWERHAGYQYLYEHKAAICVSSNDQIKGCLQEIVTHPESLAEMQRKAWECGITYHSRKAIQNQIKNVFESVLS